VPPFLTPMIIGDISDEYGHDIIGTILRDLNASPAARPIYPELVEGLSVCGSQVHSAPALASAHTLPDSLSPASGLTTPVHSLYII
jgi:hypothetical protein